MPFSGLSGRRGEFAASEAKRKRERGGGRGVREGAQVLASMSPMDEGSGGRDRWTDREGRAEPGFHVLASKWEAGLEGDRLCLLLICQPVNGRKEERRRESGGLLSRDQSTQGMMGGKKKTTLPPGQ